CTFGREAPPLLPLVLEGRFQDYGLFVHLLPVTSLVARDIGRAMWNFPKLVADMEFEKRPAYQRVRWSQGDDHVLTLTVKQRGVPVRDNRPLVCYTAMKGSLIETEVPIRSVYQLGLAPGSGTIQLGTHKIADHLREIGLSTNAIATRNYLSRAAMLPEGRPIGPADTPFQIHAGNDRPLGRLTVSYDNACDPIDLYADRRS